MSDKRMGTYALCLEFLIRPSRIDSSLYFKDKGDGSDAEPGAQEEDSFIQDEIYKSRLASIKRVSSFVISCCLYKC